MDTCSDLCDLVQEKTQSDILEFICTMGCSALGIVEFVKLVEQADLDPIYYCEVIQLCPINDQGDAKFKSFAILPAQGRIGTKFSIDFVFVSKNGTGTGEIIITVHTLDKVRVSGGFLLEAQKPGTYGDRVVVDATPDPKCDPDENPCEQWYPAVYNLTVMICNGACGSHHPHTQLYDTAVGAFQITQ